MKFSVSNFWSAVAGYWVGTMQKAKEKREATNKAAVDDFVKALNNFKKIANPNNK